jgi:integrase
MPKKLQNEKINGTYYTWVLRERNGVWFADGRANTPPLGRHSLGTRDREQAGEFLRELDLTKAVENGLADRSLLQTPQAGMLDLEAGRQLYKEHVNRSETAGGAREETWKRYRAIFDKFIPFATGNGISAWNQVTRRVLESYSAWLDDEGYAPRTETIELTTIKQAMKWLAEDGHIPSSCLFKMKIRKYTGTDTYCWKPEEVAAIIGHCRVNEDLKWLADVFTSLVVTGLRISELASLRWSDVNWDANSVVIRDESSRKPTKSKKARQTKTGKSRVVPLHAELRTVLEGIPRSQDGVIFHGPLGGRLKPDTVRNVLRREVLELLSEKYPTPDGEIGFIDGRLHSCRHFFCSRCVEAGVPEQTIMRWLGHSDSKMVRHYYHLREESSQGHMIRVPAVVGAGGVDTAGEVSKVTPKEPAKKTKKEKK